LHLVPVQAADDAGVFAAGHRSLARDDDASRDLA
jgi:hypothetical protein